MEISNPLILNLYFFLWKKWTITLHQSRGQKAEKKGFGHYSVTFREQSSLKRPLIFLLNGIKLWNGQYQTFSGREPRLSNFKSFNFFRVWKGKALTFWLVLLIINVNCIVVCAVVYSLTKNHGYHQYWEAGTFFLPALGSGSL